MRKTALALALLLLAGIGIGCEAQTAAGESEYVLYFLPEIHEQRDQVHGPALVPQPWEPEEGTELSAETLLHALLDGPTQEGLVSPFSRNVYLLRVIRDEAEPGHLQVLLSEAYSGLTDISLTLADYAIVLTLSQLEGVESVEISSTGYAASYRSHEVLSPEEAELFDPLAASDSSS